jgi:hypothetical protein
MNRPAGEVPKTQRARTRWAVLDRFIEALADMGDGVCEAPPESRYFEEMQRLLCRGDLSAVPRYAPYYHYVFAAFYALFHRGDVHLAEAVVKILMEAHVKDEFADSYEAEAIRVLATAVQAVKAADCSRPEIFRAQLKVAAEIIRASGGGEADSWSRLFRDLTAAYLDPAAGVGRIKKAIEETLRDDDLPQEIVEAYGLFPSDNTSATPLYFIYRMAERLEKVGTLEKPCLNSPHKLLPLREGH